MKNLNKVLGYIGAGIIGSVIVGGQVYSFAKFRQVENAPVQASISSRGTFETSYKIGGWYNSDGEIDRIETISVTPNPLSTLQVPMYQNVDKKDPNYHRFKSLLEEQAKSSH